jgi:3-hydroxyacyl-[acyl-carrier-protein] dehydratase
MNNQVFNELIQFDSLQKLEDGKFILPFSILKTSNVFEGHFPQQPILPGVVMVEILKRAVRQATGQNVQLIEAGNFKFLKMIDPTVLPKAELNFAIVDMDGIWKVKAQITNGADTYFKANAQYHIG